MVNYFLVLKFTIFFFKFFLFINGRSGKPIVAILSGRDYNSTYPLEATQEEPKWWNRKRFLKFD
jgi:hypothetical protein